MFITVATNYNGMKSLTIDKDTIMAVVLYEDYALIHRKLDLPSIKIGIDGYDELVSYLNGSRYEKSIAASNSESNSMPFVDSSLKLQIGKIIEIFAQTRANDWRDCGGEPYQWYELVAAIDAIEIMIRKPDGIAAVFEYNPALIAKAYEMWDESDFRKMPTLDEVKKAASDESK